MRSLNIVAAALAIAGFASCSDDNKNGTPDAKPTPDAPASHADGATATNDAPLTAGTVKVNFGPIDDSANQVYGPGDLEWKGALILDSASNKLTVSADGWNSPTTWPLLFDDGPVPTGHEPPGSLANDHKWGVQVSIDVPATGTITGEYGLNDRSYRLAGGDGWIWRGSNGTFTVNANQTTDVTAEGLTFPAFGTVDLKIVLDTTMVAAQDPDAGSGFDVSKVSIKSSAWAWVLVPVAIADGKATFIMSTAVCTAKPCEAAKVLNHSGLLNPGDKPEFVFVLGGSDAGVGQEYFSTMGTTAFYRTSAADNFDDHPLTVTAPTKNPTVTIPSP